ncbi:hypothetical protein [Paratractidigestivibacter sp.]|uniref:hypothetical protein n=1 Tax=Paratractidigestivibacter sp. TaxID=2847316 RepID=UPI002ACB0DA4|nr:hypothetical protein [Paratractidigestivibacter sp.]
MVTEIKLPKVPGYVETVVDGEHVYRDLRTGEITRDPKPPEKRQTVEERMDALEAAIERGLNL